MSANERWNTCPHCAGSGLSPAYRGVFTDDDITEIGEHFMVDFRVGTFSRWCSVCAGTGRIRSSQRNTIECRSSDERASDADIAYGYPY